MWIVVEPGSAHAVCFRLAGIHNSTTKLNRELSREISFISWRWQGLANNLTRDSATPWGQRPSERFEQNSRNFSNRAPWISRNDTKFVDLILDKFCDQENFLFIITLLPDNGYCDTGDTSAFVWLFVSFLSNYSFVDVKSQQSFAETASN